MAGGQWLPCSAISYGVAHSSFIPITQDILNQQQSTSGVKLEAESVNPHQVGLEVGDEVYVFEVFRPARSSLSAGGSSGEGVWLRGYVVSTSPHPRLPLASSTSEQLSDFPNNNSASGPALQEEPQVSVGIFPASHVHIREELEDAERRLAELSVAAGAGGSSPRAETPRGSTNGRMEPLHEEEEDEEDDPTTPVTAAANALLNGGYSPQKAKNRASVSSMASFAAQLSPDQQLALQNSRMSMYGATNQGEYLVDNRPPPPLPNLKCGDETASGAVEPLVDEIACALREWATLLYTHLHRRDYALFESVKHHIDVLHAGRRQLLARTLSVDETDKLRKELVARLVRGNVEQGLDVIVRHPMQGGLIDVDVEGEIDKRGWVSAVRMYAMQVALAYGATSTEGGLSPSAPNVHASDPLATQQRLAPPTLAPGLNTPSSKHEVTGAQFYHVVVDVRAFAAQPCVAGESSELYFSLFNKTDSRFVTEEFCVVLNSQGNPIRENDGGVGSMRTLFRDLSQHDIQDQLFLVCRIVKNGAIKQSFPVNGGSGSNGSTNGSVGGRPGALLSPPSARSDTGSFDSAIPNSGEFSLDDESGMLHNDRSGRQTYRRPFGCAVLEISQLSRVNASEDEQIAAGSKQHQMPIFVSINEANFSTLHEDIIGSRIKEIEKSPRADYVGVTCRVLFGEAPQLVRELPNLLTDVAITNRIGFPDVVYPDDQRNEVYVKLWSGDFSSSAAAGRALAQFGGGNGKNIEVTVEVRTRDGAIVERAISRGAGQPYVTHYSSLVFRSNNHPSWGELVKLEIPVNLMEHCHVFFTFRTRSSKDKSASTGAQVFDRPFAFGYLPLFQSNSAFQPDGSHHLALYRYEGKSMATPALYFQAPPTTPGGRQVGLLPQSIAKVIVPTKDAMVVRTFLVSTRYTQNEVLLKLLRWEKELLNDPEELKDVLAKLKFCSEVELCKFLRDIFEALFGILISSANQTGEMDELVFQALVTILGIVSDRRFSHFKSVLDVYIARHFTGSTASSHIIRSLQKLLKNASSPESGTILRASIKAWHYLFKFILRSREIQRAKDVGMGVTSDHLEGTFKRDLSSLLGQINQLMRSTAPSSIIGTQTLAVQHFASILPDLSKCFDNQELADIAIAFVDSISASKGKIVVWKILFQNELVTSCIFESPTGRAALVPNLIRWLKPTLGKFDEAMLCSPKDSQATRDNARVSWIEGIRLSVGVVAAMLDSIQEALVDQTIQNSRSLLGQEQDSIEYLLGLIPKLLDSFRELESLSNLDSVERQRNQASVVAAVPVVFPSTYPFSLLAYPAEHAKRQQQQRLANTQQLVNNGGDSKSWPTLQSGVGEIAAVFIGLLLVAPAKIFVGWLEATLEVEGKDNFAKMLTQIFRVAKAILDNEAYPADWLNINILAHRVIVKLLSPVADILEREFIPAQSASFTFQTSLWRDFFAMLLKLLASPQLLIEEFSPQKRRAVWRLAGDIRGEGAKILLRLWDAIGWPEERSGAAGRSGGYQVQFVPGLVEDVLSLCLSHHDELRTNAAHVLHSMIVSEYYLNNDFAAIEAEVIDRLDKLFMSQTKGDEVSRAFFVGQLRTLFDQTAIDDRLAEQVDQFLNSINSFLDLLLAVRNLPEGEEYQEDRIISTLKLMSFIRQIGRSEIYIRYVNRLVTFHVALGNETEAGLTLKLHADLHEWDLGTFVDALPDLDLPRQTEFARKETLYMRILDHLSKGKAWETALTICKELQIEYETRSFNYARLAELLVLESELYASIAKGDRVFGDYFRVAFYGSRFPHSVSGKQFVYRGQPFEKLGQFTEKMLNKHPQAQLLKTSTIPTEDVQFADGQLLQITACVPEPDLGSVIFTNPDVPIAVKQYYQQNDTQTFSFTRPVNKHSIGRTRVTNDFTSLWTEKTILICEDSFPTVLRRSEVVEIRLVDISPIENALSDVEAKTTELNSLERRYHALSQTTTDASRINSNPLTMALNAVVDPPQDQGVPMYRHAFLGPDFTAVHPEKTPIVRKLERAIDDLVLTISRCLQLHSVLCPQEMKAFHDTLEQFFERHFADELARLPPQDAYELPQFALVDQQHAQQGSLASLGVRPVRSGRQESISISNVPSIQRHGSVSLSLANDGGLGRRDSTATIRTTNTLTPERRPSSTSTFRGLPPLAKDSASIMSNSTVSRTPSFYKSASGRTLDPLDEAASPTRSSFAGESTRTAGGGSASSTGRRLSKSVKDSFGGGVSPSQQLGAQGQQQQGQQGVTRRPSVLGLSSFSFKRRQSTAPTVFREEDEQ